MTVEREVELLRQGMVADLRSMKPVAAMLFARHLRRSRAGLEDVPMRRAITKVLEQLEREAA
jgi:hypothetical protein